MPYIFARVSQEELMTQMVLAAGNHDRDDDVITHFYAGRYRQYTSDVRPYNGIMECAHNNGYKTLYRGCLYRCLSTFRAVLRTTRLDGQRGNQSVSSVGPVNAYPGNVLLP